FRLMPFRRCSAMGECRRRSRCAENHRRLPFSLYVLFCARGLTELPCSAFGRLRRRSTLSRPDRRPQRRVLRRRSAVQTGPNPASLSGSYVEARFISKLSHTERFERTFPHTGSRTLHGPGGFQDILPRL